MYPTCLVRFFVQNKYISLFLKLILGSIGGSIGLFVGASVLTMFEFLDMLFCKMPIVRRLRGACSRNKVSVIRTAKSNGDHAPQ